MFSLLSRLGQFYCLGLITASIVLTSILPAYAQMSPVEHKSHHPEQSQSEQISSQPSIHGPPGKMSGGLERMTELMEKSKQKGLYPSLMELHDISSEKQSEILQQAHERRQAGMVLLSEGWEHLLESATSNDYAGLQEATTLMHEGLSQFESGLAAQRALAEGVSPKKVALQWFKRDMHLLPPIDIEPSNGPYGLSWFHFVVMGILFIFTGSMFYMYRAKMQRAAALMERLTQASTTANVSPTHDKAPDISSTPKEVNNLQERQLHSQDPRPKEAIFPTMTEKVPTSSFTAAGVKPDKWSGTLRVARIFQETPNVKTFRFVNPDGGPLPFTYQPGQFLILTVKPEGEPVKRSYTIASSPSRQFYCEVTIKREHLGMVSGYMHDKVKERDVLEISAPYGVFTFTGKEADSIVFVGGGVGITPLMSVIRYLTDIGWEKDIYFLYSCRTSSDFIFREELETLQRRNPNLQVFATMTRTEGTVWMGFKGHFNKDLIESMVPDLAKRRIHVCGPPPMMEAVMRILGELGVPQEQIKTEAFGPAMRPAAKRALAEGCTCEQCEHHRHEQEAKAAATAGTAQAPAATPAATVTFQKSGKSAPLPPDECILDVADRVGVEIPYVCRVGVCGTCKAKLLSGTVTMEVEEGLEPGEKEQGIILTCQAKSTNDVIVEA